MLIYTVIYLIGSGKGVAEVPVHVCLPPKYNSIERNRASNPGTCTIDTDPICLTAANGSSKHETRNIQIHFGGQTYTWNFCLYHTTACADFLSNSCCTCSFLILIVNWQNSRLSITPMIRFRLRGSNSVFLQLQFDAFHTVNLLNDKWKVVPARNSCWEKRVPI